MKTSIALFLSSLTVCLSTQPSRAQVNSGSDGSDGIFAPTTSLVTLDMADHPDGIYRYNSVNIPLGTQVRFIPNSGNSPVIWLVKGDVTIGGDVSVSANGRQGGPGGFAGGVGGTANTPGQGPGGGRAGDSITRVGEWGTFEYGNKFLLPLIGGSGGGGAIAGGPQIDGGGGGGAILIVSSGRITVNGSISAGGYYFGGWGGTGSGGAIRLVANHITGAGSIDVRSCCGAGAGKARLDSPDLAFSGTLNGPYSLGYQPVLFPTDGSNPNISIESLAGNAVPVSPSGSLTSPDTLVGPQQRNPVPIVVRCSNIALNTPITITVKPQFGVSVSKTGFNSSGTLASSTATVVMDIPRGGGQVYATAGTVN